MPKNKLKSKRGAKKRFKRTASGNYLHKSSHRRHILTKKSSKRKRQLRGNSRIKDCDRGSIDQMIGSK